MEADRRAASVRAAPPHDSGGRGVYVPSEGYSGRVRADGGADMRFKESKAYYDGGSMRYKGEIA